MTLYKTNLCASDLSVTRQLIIYTRQLLIYGVAGVGVLVGLPMQNG